MLVASDLVPHLARITGLPLSKVISVQRRLTETGIWPSRRGAYVPGLTTTHVVMMLLALLAAVPAKDAARAATAYFELTSADGHRLGERLVRVVDSFKRELDMASLALKSRVIVDCDNPRVCISFETTEGQYEQLFGVHAAQWEDLRVRRSMTISGKCIFDIACGLHFDRWESWDVA